MSDLEHRLRADLAEAMRARDRETVRVLRTALAAISNAEAQPVVGADPVSLRGDGPIAGAADGVGAAEVDRRVLNDEDLAAILLRERDERISAADELAERGAADAADVLRAEATLLESYLR